jgi:hypothetical protein
MVVSVSAEAPVDLTYEAAVAAALFAGFSDQDAVTMAAISTLETSRNCLAISGKLAGGNSRKWGAFAVTMTPQQAVSPGWMAPTWNAGQALTQMRLQGFRAWGSYSSGLYAAAIPSAQLALAAINMKLKAQPAGGKDAVLQRLAQPDEVVAGISGIALQWEEGAVLGPAVNTGVQTVGQLGAATAGATVDTVFKPFGSVLDFLNALGNPAVWARVAMALVGGALIVVALRQVAT